MTFSTMPTTEFAAHVGKNLSAQPAIQANKGHGPVLPIHFIETSHLPVSLVTLINEVLNCPWVVDHMPASAMPWAGAKDASDLIKFAHKINSSEPGAMRSWHSNEHNYLPVLGVNHDGLSSTAALDIKDRRSKAQSYHQYIVANKGQQNKMVGRTTGEHSGYIEFTGTGWLQGHQHGRLVFDYVNNRLYLTFHYKSYLGDDKNPFFLVKFVHGSRGLPD